MGALLLCGGLRVDIPLFYSVNGLLFIFNWLYLFSLGFRLQQELAFSAVENWGKIKHPNIARLREAFTTRAFGDHCG